MALECSEICIQVSFSLLRRACCFDYFNIPTCAPVIYTLKSTKFTLKHLKQVLSVLKCFNVNLVLFKVYIIGA
jgi:hypothetical protein